MSVPLPFGHLLYQVTREVEGRLEATVVWTGETLDSRYPILTPLFARDDHEEATRLVWEYSATRMTVEGLRDNETHEVRHAVPRMGPEPACPLCVVSSRD